MKKIVLGIGGVVACPCHIPIYLTLLSGSAVGGALAAHRGWLLIGMSLLFVAALIALTDGGALLPQRARSCPVRSALPGSMVSMLDCRGVKVMLLTADWLRVIYRRGRSIADSSAAPQLRLRAVNPARGEGRCGTPLN